MDRKLIFLDIDGTITMPGMPPSTETINAVRAARQNGHKVFLCTGRSTFAIDQAVADIGFDGGIYHAGGRVLLGDRELVNATMDAEKVMELLHFLSGMDITFHLESTELLFSRDIELDWDALDLSQASTELLRQIKQKKSKNSRPVSEYNGQPVYKAFFRTYTLEQRQRLCAAVPKWAKLVLFENFFPEMTITAGEISDPRTTKATAMEAICRAFGATPEDCIAFGDSMNDAEILKAAGLGIAMGNAAPKVKNIADLVCESCEEDGIAKTLQRLGLI